MNIRRITDKIDYVGVNDRTTSLFEGLWPLPYGVSYNSYLVKGSEKTALIDTVELGHMREFMESIRMNGIERIDYLIINHMEPDHSGGIPVVVSAFPDIKIVGNKKTIDMIKGFYHLMNDDLYLEVAEGQILELGDIELKFFLTPMLHWPETMMTYCEVEKLLFTGDAFGCFGALNGGVVDDTMECGLYIEEIYRYYSNIIAKYGKFVLTALAKVAPLQIDYICSTHGPVWHSMIPQIMDIYRRLASFEGEEGVTIVYGSMYGNTAEMAELFGIELSRLGVKNIRIHNASKSNLSDMIADAVRYKGLIIGSPTYNTEIYPPVAHLVSALRARGVQNKIVASFGGFTWAPGATKKIAENLEAMNLTDAGSVVMKQAVTEETEQSIRSIAEKFVKML